jgi:hypothetical protein
MEVMTKPSKTFCAIFLCQFAIVPLTLSPVVAAASAEPAPPATGSESLGGKLLDDLNPSQFGPPAPSPAPAPQPSILAPQPAMPAPARQSFQKRIVPDLSDGPGGEDIGQRSGSAVLARIEEQMGTAKSLLHQAKAPDRAGEVQQQVVADLDSLIAQLSKQCQGGASQSNSECKSPSQRSQASGAKPAAKPGHSSAPARDSTTRIGHNDPGAVDLGDREQLLKDFWGHLPPHAREQMLQSHSDEFLPQYELEIEQYYKRLSEENENSSAARP